MTKRPFQERLIAASGWHAQSEAMGVARISGLRARFRQPTNLERVQSATDLLFRHTERRAPRPSRWSGACHPNRHANQPTNHRRGAFLVVALICLLLSTALLGTLLTMVQSQRRQMVKEQMRLQADWLAESALERAAAKLRSDAGYSREAWSIPAGELGGDDSGEVAIEVERPENQPGLRLVHVEAIYPAGSTQPVRRTRHGTVVLIQE